MEVAQMSVPDAYLLTPGVHRDERGSFLEWYRHEALREVLGYSLSVAQANCSVSAKGVVRGLHYADTPPGQAKYVTCLSGAVLDVVVDLREGSATFGRVEAVRLDDVQRRAVYLAEGLGHAFRALTDGATVAYLCSTVYNVAAEHGIHPLDPELALPWPAAPAPMLSPKDAAAPSLALARSEDALPTYAACQARYEQLRRAGGAAT